MEKFSRFYLPLLSISHGMNHVYQLLIPIILPKITADYNLSNFTAGILLACFTLSYSLLQTLFGYLSGILGRKNILVLGFVITSISFFTFGFVDNIIFFAGLLFLAGIGGSTYHPNGIALVSEKYLKNRGQALGFHQTGGSFGSFIAPLLVGFLVLNINWRLTVTSLSLFGVVLSIILWFFLDDPKKMVKEKEAAQLNKVNRKFNMKLYVPAFSLIFAAMIYTTGLRGVDAFANQYFIYERGIADFIEASFLFSMLKVAGFFSGPACGKLSDIFGRKKMLYVLIILEAMSLYVFTIIPTGYLIIPCILFGFASFGLLTVTDAFMTDITPREYMGTIFGVHFTMSFMTSVIISPILGRIADVYSFNLGFVILSAIIPISILILSQIKKKKSC